MTAKAMCLHIKVVQLNTLSVGKQITGIPSRPTGYRFLNKMENENTHLRKLADVFSVLPRFSKGQGAI